MSWADDGPSEKNHTPAWTQAEAIRLCKQLEEFAPTYGCHVALTGGLLYKDGPRKDADILLYRIRQVTEIDMDGMEGKMLSLGITLDADMRPYGESGWVRKAITHDGKAIDFFFPESDPAPLPGAPSEPAIILEELEFV